MAMEWSNTSEVRHGHALSDRNIGRFFCAARHSFTSDHGCGPVAHAGAIRLTLRKGPIPLSRMTGGRKGPVIHGVFEALLRCRRANHAGERPRHSQDASFHGDGAVPHSL